MAWALAASTILIALVAIGVLRGRHPRTATRPRVSTSGSPAKPGSGAAAEAKRDRPVPRNCPVCLSEYPEPNRFCVRDGAALVQGKSHGPFAPGMICPACRRGYPADASFCPEDAEELVPYGLYGAASSTKPPLRIDVSKICPECGIHHAPSHFFCRQDGTELVVVN
jgi:hypothetical protein